MEYRLTDFLPTTKKELELRGWDYVDVILFSGDAYVDHPSFGAAVIGRTLEAAGYRVAIVPQPDWHGDFRDFKKLGRPRLFFGISPGCMDSMVNKYTAARRLRSEDAYSPDGRHDLRPEYPTIVYSRILRQLYPDVPIVLGGIEASLRRLTHYDYWQDRLRPCILVDAPADIISYGMGEKTILEIARKLESSVECRVDSVEFATALENEECRVKSASSVECRVDSVEFATALDASTNGEGSAVANSKLYTLNSKLKGSAVANSKLYTLNSKLKGSAVANSKLYTLNSKLKGSAVANSKLYTLNSTLRNIPQTVFLATEADIPGGITADDIVLHSHEDCLKDKRAQAENFRHIEEQSNMIHARRLIQPLSLSSEECRVDSDSSVECRVDSDFSVECRVDSVEFATALDASTNGSAEGTAVANSKLYTLNSTLKNPLHSKLLYVVVNPPWPPMTTEELDASFDLPYTRLPHPKYKGKRIPAYEMIKHSVNIHRGCFGGCAFCTISAHQGKFIACRSKESILKEVRQVIQMDDFKGYLSDLGGPSANMYGMKGRNLKACEKCRRPSCIHPQICPNLNTDHSALTDLYRSVDALPGIKKSFIGSGVRYDLLLHRSNDAKVNQAAEEYTRELITRHVSGRLKVAPEHTSDRVLMLMRKPPFALFRQFKQLFDRINRAEGLRQQIIPYFISSHPGCHEEDMAELAVITKDMDFQLEQVQDFTPTPMTVATETWYTGYDPYTLEPVYAARTAREKLAQRQFFFWYKPEERRGIEQSLRRIGRPDLIASLLPSTTHNSPKTAHPSPSTPHHSPITPHHSPITPHHSPITPHHSPITTHHSPITPHHSPITPHHSPNNDHPRANRHPEEPDKKKRGRHSRH